MQLTFIIYIINEFLTSAVGRSHFLKRKKQALGENSYSQTALILDYFNNLGFLAKWIVARDPLYFKLRFKKNLQILCVAPGPMPVTKQSLNEYLFKVLKDVLYIECRSIQ